jgi:hypothetical protein
MLHEALLILYKFTVFQNLKGNPEFGFPFFVGRKR